MRQRKNERRGDGNRLPAAVIVLQVLLVAVLAGLVIFIVFGRKNIKTKKSGTEDTGNVTDDTKSSRGSEDVVLVGAKKGDESTGHARDYIMLCHIDYDKEKTAIVSIYRDTMMQIPGYGNQRVMNAFSLGGPELLLKTINQNLDLNINNYAIIYYNDADTLKEIYDAAMNKEKSKVASLTSDMLSSMKSNTNSGHERKWVGALGNYDVNSSPAEPAHFYGGTVDNTWVEVPVTLSDMAVSVHSALYGENSGNPTGESYSVSDSVKSVSEELQTIAPTANDDLSGAP